MTHDVDALLSRLGIARNPVPTAGTATDDASPESASQAAPRPAAPAKPAIPPTSGEPFWPRAPKSLAEAGLRETEVDDLILKYLYNVIAERGYRIAEQVGLRFPIVEELLRKLKADRLIYYKNSLPGGDYVYELTEAGRDRAFRLSKQSTYFGTAPVSLEQYIASVRAQSISDRKPPLQDIRRAFGDLSIPEDLLSSVGEAIHSGRGMFLFGNAGNGKTSIAERITQCFGKAIWIPRTLGIDGDIIRLFDPGVHEEVTDDEGEGIFDLSGVDQRWVRVVRPTIVAGGELTMAELEVTQNLQTKICEAPLQLKSNCGTLVIDDFGRQTMPVDVLLNRWIVPLEKRYDFLNLPSGKKIQVPFDQLIIFSTNLEPRDLVDGAFLRRIPYKIKVPDPSREHFQKLFEIMAPKMGLVYNEEAVNYLIEEHYQKVDRPFRNCQPRDLLLQIRNYCAYREKPKEMTPESFDFAVENYFSVM